MSEQNRLEGTFRAVVIPETAQFGQAKNGSEQFAIDCSLPDVGETVTVILSFSGGARPYSIDKMAAMGISVGAADLEFASKEFSVRVFYEEWEGEERMRVDVLTSRVKLKEMDPAQKRGFLAELRGALPKAG